MKKILYIKGSGLGDIISSIPKLKQLKQDKNNKIYWLYTGNFDKSYANHLLILREKGYIAEIIKTSLDFTTLFFILVKYLYKFDLVVIGGVSTYKTIVLSYLLGKKREYNLDSLNGRDDIVKSETGITGRPFNFWNIFEKEKLPKTYEYLGDNYMVIYGSWINRTINEKEWLGLGNYLMEKGFSIVLIGGEREIWIKELYNRNNIQYVDLIGFLDFYDLINILGNSRFNICCNGGIMWVANLVNKNNINLHTVSRFLWEPPTDNIHSFNVRLYSYDECRPCEGGKNCKFKGTRREFECLNSIKTQDIIEILNKYYLNTENNK